MHTRTRSGTFIRLIWIIPAITLFIFVIYFQYFEMSSLPPVGLTSSNNGLKTLISREVSKLFQSGASGSSHTQRQWPDVKHLPDSKQLRILVTGGAGFVGSHLVDRLMREGHFVIVLDNLFTGQMPNIEQWSGHPNFLFMRHDIIIPIALEVDQIYHLACPASPKHYRIDPIKTILTNTKGTLNMLGLAKRVKARILLASSSDIYGDPTVHPQSETYVGHANPIGPRACYDEGKRVAETMMYAYYTQSNVDVRVARLFNTYGPRMQPNDGRLISNFVTQALNGQDLTVYGSGTQTRSFQYIDDLIDGLVRLMESDYVWPVNIGNPEELTVKDIANKVLSSVSSTNSILQHLPATEDDPQRRCPDITVATRELGWSPKVNLDSGIRKTVEYFKSLEQHQASSTVTFGAVST